MKNLIVFSTKTGFTEDCVNILKTKLKGTTEIVDIKKETPKDLDSYDKIIFGSSIVIGKISPLMTRLIKANLEKIGTKNIGVFITSGDKNQDYIGMNFPKEILDKAFAKEHFGVGLNTKRLSLIEKILMKMMGKYKDFSKVDEDAIKRFADAANKLK